MKRHGFTLIEILIVVAIIAILTAIAVPNLLDAQTRSKVAYAKNSLRVLALGIEMYHVDHKAFPYTESYGKNHWLPPGGRPLSDNTAECGGVTSPIAYLTSLPLDPFKEKELHRGSAQGTAQIWEPPPPEPLAPGAQTGKEARPRTTAAELNIKLAKLDIKPVKLPIKLARLDVMPAELDIKLSKLGTTLPSGTTSPSPAPEPRSCPPGHSATPPPYLKFVNYERPGFGVLDGQTTENVHVVLSTGEYDSSAFRMGPPYAAGILEVLVPDAPADWVLYSIGPDLSYSAPAPRGYAQRQIYSRYDVHNIYDPTNGTVSPGNIVRFPGGFTAPH